MKIFKVFLCCLFIGLMAPSPALAQEESDGEGTSSLTNLGIDLFEEEIDDVIFQTNEFLTNETFTEAPGPFWQILQMCMFLGALFSIIMAAGMAYKMMVKGEPFDMLKILRVLGIALVMIFWYADGGILDCLSYIPNCIGSYTHDLYEAEAMQVQERYNELKPLIAARDSSMKQELATARNVVDGIKATGYTGDLSEHIDFQNLTQAQKDAYYAYVNSNFAGIIVLVDKLMMALALVLWRIGWWATVFVQQILLGMLTIFGPIVWAFSILSKWEGAWAKWIIRYLTVHFYGAMLYFVGFYVLLLFDIVLSIQVEQLAAIMDSTETFHGYIKTAFLTGGYLLAASVISLKCLNLVPDLAAWMIPEGDTAYSTRNFGEGVAQGVGRHLIGKI